MPYINRKLSQIYDYYFTSNARTRHVTIAQPLPPPAVYILCCQSTITKLNLRWHVWGVGDGVCICPCAPPAPLPPTKPWFHTKLHTKSPVWLAAHLSKVKMNKRTTKKKKKIKYKIKDEKTHSYLFIYYPTRKYCIIMFFSFSRIYRSMYLMLRTRENKCIGIRFVCEICVPCNLSR